LSEEGLNIEWGNVELNECDFSIEINHKIPNKSDICNMNVSNQNSLLCPVISMVEFKAQLKEIRVDEVLILVDENTRKFCLPILLRELDILKEAQIFEIPSGETNKTLQHCEKVWQLMSEQQLSRQTVVINLGGGVLCDMGGLIAALFKRGLRFFNIPTTLLAMVDAAHGGKVAVDLLPFKNQIGLFQAAEALVLHPEFLSTLPQEEIVNGYAEMLKHALIADENYWEELNSLSPIQVDEQAISKSIAIKSDFVQRDPNEKNVRKLLNLGHTVGHALESYYLNANQPLKHGHAVALGIFIEAQISHDLGLLSHNDLATIGTNITKHYAFPSDLCRHTEELFEVMLNDKKNSEGQVKMVLLESIGKAIFDQKVDFEVFQKALKITSENYAS
jgi:3-dehydroquinate synthase